MVELDKVFESKVKQEGIFKFKDLYAFAYDWLADNSYDTDEELYKEVVKGNAKDIEIRWTSSKKISDYFKFVIKATWKIFGMVDVEIEQAGKKVKMNKAKFEIKVKGIIKKDYEHRWERTAFLKFLRGVYDRYIIKGRIESYEGKIFTECDEFVAQIKSFLAISAKH